MQKKILLILYAATLWRKYGYEHIQTLLVQVHCQSFIIYHNHYCVILLQALQEAHTQFRETLDQAEEDMYALRKLDRQIKSYKVSINP
jgi:hypothetical protein